MAFLISKYFVWFIFLHPEGRQMRSVLTQMLKWRIKLRSAVHLFAPREPAKLPLSEVFGNFLPGEMKSLIKIVQK